MAKRYYVKMSHTLPPEKRDVRRGLRHSRTWRDGKKPQEGSEWATGSVELTPSEVQKVQDASNVISVREVKPVENHVDTQVPSDTDLRSHEADMLYEWGFTGQGIDVGVIDSGLGSGVMGKFNIKGTRGNLGADPAHGSYTASVAVPRKSQLAFATNADTGLVADGLYFMADEMNVHVVNMSFSFPSGFDQDVADAIAHAKSKGIALFASAGNDGSPNPVYPAHNDGVTSVGALDRTKGWKKASFSNYGSWVDLWMNGVQVACYGPSGAVELQFGTSLASPLAAFVSASLLTKGLTSIGQVGNDGAMRRGSDSVPGGIGGGRRVNGRKAAFAQRDFCV